MSYGDKYVKKNLNVRIIISHLNSFGIRFEIHLNSNSKLTKSKIIIES